MSKVTDYLRRMEEDITAPDMWTKEQAEAWANEYWQIRWDKSLSKEETKAKLAAHQESFRPVRDVHVNQQGNTVVHRHRYTERYLFDFDDDFRGAGWLQFDTDQDAWYYGVWVNPKTLRTPDVCRRRRISRDLPRRRTLQRRDQEHVRVPRRRLRVHRLRHGSRYVAAVGRRSQGRGRNLSAGPQQVLLECVGPHFFVSEYHGNPPIVYRFATEAIAPAASTTASFPP